MLVSAAILWFLVVLFAVLVMRRERRGLARAGFFALDQGRGLVIRLPLAVLTASFLAEILPAEAIGGALGAESGFAGILLASILGGLMPGGPMVSFPIAVFLWLGGAGPAQITALIAGWSLFAFHRVLAFEAPIMGWRFVALRLASSLVLPPLAGLGAAGLIALSGWQPSL